MTIPSPSDFGEIFFAGSLAPSCGHLRAAATCFGSDEALPVLSCIQLGLAVPFSCCAALRCAALRCAVVSQSINLVCACTNPGTQALRTAAMTHLPLPGPRG